MPTPSDPYYRIYFHAGQPPEQPSTTIPRTPQKYPGVDRSVPLKFLYLIDKADLFAFLPKKLQPNRSRKQARGWRHPLFLYQDLYAQRPDFQRAKSLNDHLAYGVLKSSHPFDPTWALAN